MLKKISVKYQAFCTSLRVEVMRLFSLLVVLQVALILDQANSLKSSPLGPYKISDVTLSGFSSGGFMTVQFHIAFSSLIKGAAAFAGVSKCLFFHLYNSIFVNRHRITALKVTARS